MIQFSAYLLRPGFTLDVTFASSERITALFGRSGAGKSTVIGIIAGLIKPENCKIIVDGEVLSDTARGIHLPPHDRRVGLVFQDAQLFPHMNVRQNLLFGAWFRPEAERTIDYDTVIETLGLGHLLERRPAGLSGGERQRVAIGRALLSSPRLALLDEPLASLDRARKLEILPLIEILARELRVPVVYVSHAIEEVTRLAGRVVLLDGGRAIAEGPPESVIGAALPSDEPDDRFAVASVIVGRLGAYDPEFALTPVEHSAGRVYLAGQVGEPGQDIRVVIRATDVALATQRPRSLSIRNVLTGKITAVHQSDGPVARIEIALSGQGKLSATITRRSVADLGLGEDDDVYALIKSVALDERPMR